MVAVNSVSKRFGEVHALQGVSVTFREAEIHAVLGENGAGKSTLVGILSGFIKPDSGSVTLQGKSIPFGRPFECKRLGIEMVHQHFTLVPEFTVLENLALSAVRSLGRVLDPELLASSALESAKKLGWELPLSSKVSTLSVGAQQRIEILKAISTDASVIIFDEPTAVLSAAEVQDLFKVFRVLKEEGRSVILIAHKLSEITQIADRVSVLRQGRHVATAPLAETTADQLVTWMIGETPHYPSKSPAHSGPVLLGLKDIRSKGDRGEDALRRISFEVRGGEIFGIGGVDGNGQIELAEVLAGIRPFEGEMSCKGTVGYIPQDRQVDGLAMGLSIRDNLLVTGHRKVTLRSGPFLKRRSVTKWAEGLIEKFQIKSSTVWEHVSSLSGGNQQKVVVSRALDDTPDVLVAVNPTRGLDLNATQYVFSKLREARDSGAAVVLISTDTDELNSVADRKVFLSRGQLVEGSLASSLTGDMG